MLYVVANLLPLQQARVSRLADKIETIPMGKVFNPGQLAKISGQYEIIGPRGGETGEERTVTKGEPLPPTPEAGQHYILVDRTKH